ncbi:MAG: glycoside hydrolase family 3 C-terminal domain-containing protein [Melioribacteraceae bacterium]|nr:glycoside hydrolase family 3 C-terminal domain-containing protein [Melioribacteraceae bacterium]
MKNLLILVFISFSIFAQSMPYKNPDISVEERVNDLLSRLTLKEKIDLLGGTGFATKSIDRLGIPELRMADGPVGVRWGESTAFPVSIAMAATWDPVLVKGIGSAIGRETKGKARHVILGPCVNIARLPMGGRNFESFGEDPYLASRMTVNYIDGVQSEGVAATVKHFAANNQEHERMFVDVLVSERALNEIYFPAFKAAVTEAEVMCVMSSYNKVNNHFASENDNLLINKLKKEWAFDGLVMSDWGAVHSYLPTIKGGLDLEMPFGKFMNQESILKELDNGEISLETINKKVERILSVIIKLGLLDSEVWKENSKLVNSPENRESAYETSLASIVLLKNENNILPLQVDKIKTVGIIGPNAKIARTGGGGSSLVSPVNPITPLDGLKNKLNKDLKIEFAEGVRLDGDAKAIPAEFLFTDEKMKTHGLTGEYFSNMNFSGKPQLTRIDKEIDFWWHGGSPAKNIGENNFTVRWTGYLKAPFTGEYEINIASDDGIRFYLDDNLLINDWYDRGVSTSKTNVYLDQNKIYKIKIEYYENGGDAACILGWNMPNEDLINDALVVARRSDVVILFVGTSHNYETEGRDRENLLLPNNQDELIQKISEVNKNVVVVLSTGSPVIMNNWIHKVNAVVQMWFGGGEGGNAIADVLIGNYNPSGKLPITFPRRWEDSSPFTSYKSFSGRTYYTDDIYVGYRHFDKYDIEPLFPFGFGLSYTTFEYSNLSIAQNDDELKINFDIENSGSNKGEEVCQLYAGVTNSKIDRPEKELKSFLKVSLAPGEKKQVEMRIPKSSLAYFNSQTSSWELEENNYSLMVGSSSRDIILKKELYIK